jgi:thiamine-monophosphate kinase
MLLEDVHFRRSWHDPYHLGRKSLAINISDIASMGGIPRWSLLSLAIPSGISLKFLDEFSSGFLDMASEQSVVLIGGDTCSSCSGLIISVTIMGEQRPELILRRSGAKPGDDIWVTGSLGDAAMGLKLLEGDMLAQARDGDSFLLSRLLNPGPCTAAGLVLAESGLVTAMIDISDGILADFSHIAEMSDVGGILYLSNLPISSAFRDAAHVFPTFPYFLALSGGEDYELCFTASSFHREKITDLLKKCGVVVVPVGIVTDSQEVVVLDSDGIKIKCENQGFNHFK